MGMGRRLEGGRLEGGGWRGGDWREEAEVEEAEGGCLLQSTRSRESGELGRPARYGTKNLSASAASASSRRLEKAEEG